MVTARIPIGTKLGRYEVLKHLARGGMADLVIARASGIEGFERHVVIKHLRPEESEDAAFVKMFVTEARLAGALHHHNIVQVHDIGNEQGRHFFAMEYVHGEDLRRLIAQLRKRAEESPLEHVVTIISAVAGALHHAHEQRGSDRQPLGIVHRDVTPGNIIVGYDGNVKVVDFGIAKAALRPSDTGVGMLKGKVPYMSPEQCTGKPVDRRSDVFALGIVLYELVTARRLFRGGNEFHTMSAVIGGAIPPPSRFRNGLPKALEDIILKALSRDPAGRYQSADEMRAALEAFADEAKLRTSTSALESFMKRLFGQRPEPWTTDDKIEFDEEADKTEPGLTPIPIEVLERGVVPKSVSIVRGSLIEQVRRRVILSELPRASLASHHTPKVIVTREATQRDRVATDIDELTEVSKRPRPLDHTDVANPPPPPMQLPSPAPYRADAESTDIVKPLVVPTERAKSVRGAPTMMINTVADQPRQSNRTAIIAGSIALVALAISILIVATRSNPVRPDEPTVDLKVPPIEPAPIEPKPVEPKPVEPKPVEPAPVAEPTAVATKPDELAPKPEVANPPDVAANPPSSPKSILRKPLPPTKPPTRPKPPTKPPKWDPDSLFLKPK